MCLGCVVKVVSLASLSFPNVSSRSSWKTALSGMSHGSEPGTITYVGSCALCEHGPLSVGGDPNSYGN